MATLGAFVVFPLALGANSFGWTSGEPTPHAVLDAFVDDGGNLIDTADSYGAGTSDSVTGAWFAKTGRRDDVVLAAKVSRHPDRRRLAPATVRLAVEEWATIAAENGHRTPVAPQPEYSLVRRHDYDDERQGLVERYADEGAFAGVDVLREVASARRRADHGRAGLAARASGHLRTDSQREQAGAAARPARRTHPGAGRRRDRPADGGLRRRGEVGPTQRSARPNSTGRDQSWTRPVTSRTSSPSSSEASRSTRAVIRQS